MTYPASSRRSASIYPQTHLQFSGLYLHGPRPALLPVCLPTPPVRHSQRPRQAWKVVETLGAALPGARDEVHSWQVRFDLWDKISKWGPKGGLGIFPSPRASCIRETHKVMSLDPNRREQLLGEMQADRQTPSAAPAGSGGASLGALGIPRHQLEPEAKKSSKRLSPGDGGGSGQDEGHAGGEPGGKLGENLGERKRGPCLSEPVLQARTVSSH